MTDDKTQAVINSDIEIAKLLSQFTPKDRQPDEDLYVSLCSLLGSLSKQAVIEELERLYGITEEWADKIQIGEVYKNGQYDQLLNMLTELECRIAELKEQGE